MISATAHTEVNTLSNQSGVFTIKNSSKMFHLLISGLYSNKIQSITREIWSNALDGHVQAGCADRPFEVSFPSVFDPTFRVRDFGVSLTHDQVMNLYTTVGESTKEDSNDYVGKWGLGSKSPFAYTDNFTVTVVLQGEKRLYSAVIGGDGVPTIHLMGTEQTDEENGVEVSFPVEKPDVRAFTDAAIRVSHGFAVKPVVKNNHSFKGWPMLDVLASGNDWTLARGSIEGYGERAYARMGCVLYPINVSALGTLTTQQREILQAGFIMTFGMGELEMTPSREDLQYGRTQPTTNSIIKKIDSVSEELSLIVSAEYAACPTYYEACVKYAEIISDYSIPIVMRNITKRMARWNGIPLVTILESKTASGLKYTVIEGAALRRKAYRTTNMNRVTMDVTRQTVFMLEDATRAKPVSKAHQRIKNYYEANPTTKRIVWVRAISKMHMQQEVTDLMDTFEGATFINVDDLPEPPRAERGPRRPVMARVMGPHGFSNTIDLGEDGFEEGGLYVKLERMSPVVTHGDTAPVVLTSLLKKLGAIGPATDVYGAPKSMWKKFEEDQWEDLYDFAVRWLSEQTIDVAAANARHKALSAICNDTILKFIRRRLHVDKLSSDSAARVACELLDAASGEKVSDTSVLESLANAVEYKLSSSKTEEEDAYQLQYVSANSDLEELYPLFTCLMRSYGDISVDMLTDYVIMCDNTNNTVHQKTARRAA
jgi:hypothetical protein